MKYPVKIYKIRTLLINAGLKPGVTDSILNTIKDKMNITCNEISPGVMDSFRHYLKEPVTMQLGKDWAIIIDDAIAGMEKGY